MTYERWEPKLPVGPKILWEPTNFPDGHICTEYDDDGRYAARIVIYEDHVVPETAYVNSWVGRYNQDGEQNFAPVTVVPYFWVVAR